MWTVRSGSHRPRLTSDACRDVVGVVVLDDHRRGAGERIREHTRPLCGERDTGRVLGAGLQEEGGRACGHRVAQTVRLHPLVVDVDADDVAPQSLEQVEQWRERGVLDDDAITESQDVLGDAVEGVHRTVHDGHGLGRERPGRHELVLQRREHGMVEVARRERLLADAGDDGTEVGKQGGVGDA